jgi:signal transduction histidine kinase
LKNEGFAEMNTTRPRVLAIDDTPANLMVLAHALSPDYLFQIATSGREGLAMAEETRPDIVLLDVMMPEMDGNETCRHFKANPDLKDIPIIFVTALTDSTAEVFGLGLGAADYLHKPINVSVARQRIRNLIERAELEREVTLYRDHLEALVAERTRELQQANIELTAAKVATECAIRAKGTFLANISHEMYTPLNAIIGITALLRSQLNAESQRMSEKVEHSANQLHSIIKRIIQLAALEGDAGRVDAPTEFNVRDLLNVSIAHHRDQAAAKGLSLSVKVADNVPLILHGMSAGIRQAIENFLNNAIRFSDSGAICLRTDVLSAADDFVNLRFEVEDQGIGISESALPGLFERFSQADESTTRSHGGIGVGLAINHHLARLMGGEIGVESKLGQGSRFWITVPLYHFSYGWFIPNLDNTLADEGLTSASATPGELPDTGTDAKKELEQLLGLLAQDDIKAKHLWEKSYKWLAPLLGNQLNAFSEAMGTFAFDEAKGILETVEGIHAIGISTPESTTNPTAA